MQLENYDLNISIAQRADVQNRARKVGGICRTITAIEILNYFNIQISDQEIKNGLNDSSEGTDQVSMALFMSNYLHVTFCVKYDIESEIRKGENSTIINPNDNKVFSKLLDRESITFKITPPLPELVKFLSVNNALGQFVFLEDGAEMTHYGLLCKIDNNFLEFTHRENMTGQPDIDPSNFLQWWDLNGKSKLDPEQLVLIYQPKGNYTQLL